MTTTSRIIKTLAAAALFAAVPATAATTTALKPAPNATPLTWQIGTYTYDGSGNIVAISGMNDSYLYDAAGRLVQASANTADHTNSQTFSYDAFGNLLEVDASIKIGAANPGYNATILGVDSRTNRLTNPEPCNTIGTPRCVAANARGYDAAGNMRGSLNGDEYDFDPLNAILERRGASGLRQRYLYDATGERVAILYLPATGATPSNADYTLRGLHQEVLRTVRTSGTGANASWTWREDHVYRDGKLLATVTPDSSGQPTRQHVHLDHLGTPRLITDDRGYRIALHSYWPFGEEAPGSDSDAEPLKFTGHERDFGDLSERDLDYMHARHYGPVAGRFLAVDPLLGSATDPQSWNRFTYVRNAPLNTIDPDGRGWFHMPSEFDSNELGEGLADLAYATLPGLEIAFDASGEAGAVVVASGQVHSDASTDQDLTVHSNNNASGSIEVAGAKIAGGEAHNNMSAPLNQPVRVDADYSATDAPIEIKSTLQAPPAPTSPATPPQEKHQVAAAGGSVHVNLYARPAMSGDMLGPLKSIGKQLGILLLPNWLKQVVSPSDPARHCLKP